MRALHLSSIVALSLALAACGDSTGPSTDPNLPSVAGVWVGTWGGSAAQLVLTQHGDQVSGTFKLGARTRQVTGSVSVGQLRFVTAVDQSDCSIYASGDLAVATQAGTMTGVMARRSGARVCDPNAGGRVGVQQGTLTLAR
ncbi:MAG: hypothetical protein AB7L66_07250 [Gemmatimonadales bacterium]